jgi:hypothetical protein
MPKVVHAPNREWTPRERAILLTLLEELNVLRGEVGLPVLTAEMLRHRLAQMMRREM